ncbi:MAG: dicarboxylate/amino acid:cation symporter [Bacteroidota bacterium]
MEKQTKLALHWRILIAMALGVVFGIIATMMGWKEWSIDWIKPFGTIFINLLKLIALPLIIVSLIKGVSDLKDVSQLSKMGGHTILYYLGTTVFAVIVGLVLVNLFQPGSLVSEEARQSLIGSFGGQLNEKLSSAGSGGEAGPLQPLVDIVPDNIFGAATSNGNMLQVIFFVIFIGIGLVLIPEEKAQPVKAFFDGLNEVILKLIDLIMEVAPYGVFALLATLVVETPSLSLFKALIGYGLTLILALSIMVFAIYPLMVRFFAKKGYLDFFRAMGPAQLVALSTSSSAATLPVTMERVTEKLGVSETVASFVLPIGATVNMDGTSCHQAVAAIFIAQTFGMDLDLSTQLGIILTASLASIGAAAVPSAGIVMLVIVLGQAGIPEAGLAMIFAVDRPLDMCRTVVNITGDATVSLMVDRKVSLDAD